MLKLQPQKAYARWSSSTAIIKSLVSIMDPCQNQAWGDSQLLGDLWAASALVLYAAGGIADFRCLNCMMFLFADTFGPTLWIGTTQGSVVCVGLRIPGNNNNDVRTEQPVAALPTGKSVNYHIQNLYVCT